MSDILAFSNLGGSTVILVRHTEEDELLGVIIAPYKGALWHAEMAGIGASDHKTHEAAVAWCQGAFAGASGG